MDLSKFKFGIFDMDGTLIDTMPGYQKIFAELMAEFKIPREESAKFYFETAGISLPTQIEIILKNRGIEASKKIIEDLVLRFREVEKKMGLVLFKETKEVLKELMKKGITLFAFTGNQLDTGTRLEKAGIKDFFYSFIGSEKILKGVEHIEHLSRNTGYSMPEFSAMAFLVGDGAYDMEIAKKCGIYAVGITNTVSCRKLVQAGADKIISSLEELL